ncbi:MAG: hypothetical protein A4E65_01159 [Syntrophorhabdus sp. PtaU1.Bin153]|nr:MAG: hypothetical protein A4E65_01159 [Syntrophorhabdus sp. PtaU1.Bin153]
MRLIDLIIWAMCLTLIAGVIYFGYQVLPWMPLP